MKKILLIALTLFSASAINAQTLLARYPMDSNANDVSGNGNNGTINGSVTPVADRFGTPGSALQFSGGNISTSFYGVGGNGNRTIVFWCKIDPGSNGGVPFSYGGGPTGGDFANNFIPGSGWYFDASNTAGTFACRVNDGAWHQYMVTFDNSIALNTTGLRFYRDGTELNNLVGPYNWGGEFLSTWSNTPLGMGSGNIAMDEFKMYSGAFTRTQVDSIYKAEATYNSCLVGKYDFNNNGFDYSPSRTNASSVLASQDYDRAGNYGAAYAFSGAPGTTAGPCSTVQIPDSLLPMGSTPRTVMAWMKTSDAINDQVVIDYGTLGSGNRCALMVSSGIALMRIDGVDMPVGNVADGLWHHVAFSCNGSTGNIFIDGVGINSGPFAFNTLSSLYMNVGATTPNGSSQTECFNGNIDDIRIFNCSLTGTQIDSIYDHEKVCNLSVTATMNQNITCAGGSDGSATATVVSGGVAPYLYSWAPGSQTAQTPTDLTVGAHTVTVTDNVGCVATATVNITEPAPVTPFISS
ncbi:MAG TPA: LamG-like jellyroll fold domain-containing protein, partial [Bacteroidia bacterium]